MQFDKINAAKRPATPSTSANSSQNSSKSRFCDQKTRFFCHCASMGRSVAWALRRVNGLQVSKLGRCTKFANGNTVVFRDATSSLDDLIARVQENPVHLTLADVTIEEPGHPIEGENWRPQLAPYKPWVHDAASMRLRSLMAPMATCSSWARSAWV